MVNTALLVVVSPALFHTVLSVVVSVAEALVAEAHRVFLSVVVASHSFRLRILTLLSSRWHDTGLLPSVLVAEPPELSWLKCAGQQHKGNTSSNAG